MAESKFAGWKLPRKGEPWEDWEDAKILDDFYYGCEGAPDRFSRAPVNR